MCAPTSSRLMIFPVQLLMYCNDNNIFFGGGGGTGHFFGGGELGIFLGGGVGEACTPSIS